MLRGYDPRAVLHELRYRWRRRRPQGTPPLVKNTDLLVSVVCVTNRPEQWPHVLKSFSDQTWTRRELILVANTAHYPLDQVEEAEIQGADIHALSLDAQTTLGECLNTGFAAANGDVIVRFDDDDHYASTYLDDVVNVFATIDAQVTGRTEYFAFIEGLNSTIRRFPGRAERHVGRVAGGSLAVVASATASLRFPHANLGEDVEYVRRCERAGLRIWAASPEGFLQIRRPAGHAWHIDDESFAADSVGVGKGLEASYWIKPSTRSCSE